MNRLRKPLRTLLLLALALLPRDAVSGHDPAAISGEELVFGLHPFMQTTDLLRSFTPLTEYLSNAVGRPVRIEIAKDYQAHIEAVGENRRDIAYLGPVPYVRVVDAHGPKPILAQTEVEGNNTFRGAIIVRRDGKLETLADLAGKRFAFGDPNSTMSHLVPYYMLREAGITKNELGGFEHVKNHAAVALGVLSGMFDAGAVNESVFREYEQRGLKVLAWTAPIATHVFVTRSDMPERTVRVLRQAMLKLREETYGSVILHAIKPSLTDLTPGKDSDFDNLRTILRTLDEAGDVP